MYTLPQSYHKPGIVSLLDWCQKKEWRNISAVLQRAIEAEAAGRSQQQQQQGLRQPERPLPNATEPLIYCMASVGILYLWAAVKIVLYVWPMAVSCWPHWHILARVGFFAAAAAAGAGVMHLDPELTAWVMHLDLELTAWLMHLFPELKAWPAGGWHAARHPRPAAPQQQQQHAPQERQHPEKNNRTAAAAGAAGPSSSGGSHPPGRSSQLCAICLDTAATIGIFHKKGDVVHCCLCPGCADELKKKGQLSKCVYCQEPVGGLLKVVGT